MASVQLRQVRKTGGIHGIDLEIADGEFVVFVGPSGCGKSTLLRMIAGRSGGQRQRVAIGRAIVRQPKVFLFDAPLSNLDAQLRGEIKKLHQRLGATIIHVTHDQAEAMTLADRIVVLSAGHRMQYGTPADIDTTPPALFVAGFTGSPPMNLVPCRIPAGYAHPGVAQQVHRIDPAACGAQPAGMHAGAGGIFPEYPQRPGERGGDQQRHPGCSRFHGRSSLPPWSWPSFRLRCRSRSSGSASWAG
jgi:ABC-type sugar transport system ATPase subunit